MVNETHSDSLVSFVFASETTPAQAMQIHAAVTKVVPRAALRARPEQKCHYGADFGFQYVELDTEEPVRAALKNLSHSRDAWIESKAQRPHVAHFIEPLGFVLIVLSAVGAGAAGDIGKDLWKGVKSGVAWLWRRLRQHDEQPSPFAQLFDDLSCLHNHKTNWNPVVLLQLTQVHLTFVVEPRLPKEAVRQAEGLVLRPRRNVVDLPLRWHGGRSRWLPVENAFLSEEALRELWGDINRRGEATLRWLRDREK